LGAVLGGAFGQFANALLPATTASSGAYALVGMGAVFAGHISLETLRPILKDYDTMCDVVIASDLIEQSNTAVSSGDSLDMVMQFFGKYDLDEIPVMDNGGLIGVVRRSDVIEAYNREIFKLDMCSSLATSLSLQQKVHSQRVSLAEGFQILGANPLDEFTGKTLEELQLRERFSATVRTIKRELEGVDERVSYILPKPSTVIQKGDRLILFGLQKDLSRFPVV
jgi:K+/H+ antiporter YhaU regulatory subunit KhtT